MTRSDHTHAGRPRKLLYILCGAMFSIGSAASFAGEESDQHPATESGEPIYHDSADIPAHDPSLRRPQTVEESEINVRQEPSGPDEKPGAKRGSLVPIAEDNDGIIDPH